MIALVSIDKIKKAPLKGYLCPKEIAVCQKIPAAKKDNWLVARFAAKKVIHFYFLEKFGFNIGFKNIEIISRKFQKPLYKIAKASMPKSAAKKNSNKVLLELVTNTNIGISHSNGVAAAAIAATSEEGLIGLDLEKIRNFDSLTLNAFLNDREKKILKGQAHYQSKMAILLWCIKEAYLKAKGCGLIYHPKFIEIYLDKKKNTCKIKDKGKEISAKAKWSIMENGYVLAQINLFS